MIHLHSDDGSKNTNAVKIKIRRPEEKKTTPFPQYRLEDDVVIDDILNTLREEENAAHE